MSRPVANLSDDFAVPLDTRAPSTSGHTAELKRSNRMLKAFRLVEWPSWLPGAVAFTEKKRRKDAKPIQD